MPSLFRTLPSLDATTDHRRSGGVTGLRAWVVGTICSLALLSGCSQSAAPSSTFVLLDGTQQTTQDLRGKVVLVNFWATSCVTCVAEMPELVSTFEKYRARGYETLAVAMSYDPPSYVVNFAQTRKLPFKVAIDNTGAVAKAWGDVRITPTTYLVNKRGEIVRTYVGAPDFAQLHQLIEQLLAES
jgi:peroxiredoxin